MKIGHFFQINDKDVKTVNYWRGQTKLENTADTFSIYWATYNIESDPYIKTLKSMSLIWQSSKKGGIYKYKKRYNQIPNWIHHPKNNHNVQLNCNNECCFFHRLFFFWSRFIDWFFICIFLNKASKIRRSLSSIIFYLKILTGFKTKKRYCFLFLQHRNKNQDNSRYQVQIWRS